MPEYVYALHDFIPEHEDEVPFRAGERIEVIERDDAYGDGWWQGRNLAGVAGLFPQSYTAPAPPTSATPTTPDPKPANSSETPTPPDESLNESTSSRTILQPLAEEPEDSPPAAQPPAPAILVNGEGKAGKGDGDGDGEMMQATMTDVQKAIEQLGRNRHMSMDQGSFSFASSKYGDGEATDTEYEISDADDEQGWHKDARRRLAEKARRAVEEAEKLEAIMNDGGERSLAPPIEVEMSDESEEEDEEDYTRTSFNSVRRHSNILEEDEEEEERAKNTPLPVDDDDQPASVTPEPAVEPETAKGTTFTESSVSSPAAPAVSTPVEEKKEPSVHSESESKHSSLPTPISPRRASTPLKESVVAEALPSPSTSSVGVPHSQVQSKHSSADMTSPPQPAAASEPPATENKRDREKIPPVEWTVEEVVEWLKTKGFGTDVCEKFTEQEITGDVLLELDVNLLKTEIGIMAFGKRMRITNAITDLRRPPSIVYSDHPEASPVPHFPQSPSSLTHSHSRHQSQTISHHSFPRSTRSSVGAQGQMLSPESADMERVAQLSLSPSDSNLGATASESTVADEERGVLSETEALPMSSGASKRRKLFGRSHDSAASTGKESTHSKEKESVTSPASVHSDKSKGEKKDKESSGPTPRHKSRKSIDNSHHEGSRLSIFGGTFSNKGRKPPPRYSTLEDFTPSPSSGSGFLPRFGSSSKKGGSGRPGTSEGPTTKEKIGAPIAQKEPPSLKEPQLLRKRTSSYPTPHNKDKEKEKEKENAIVSPLKQGQSILSQIGEPDHAGWMRKKGDRYNGWKMRYFVLKGPHMYCLKSASESETKIKGYINIIGYKVTVDENVNPGKYNFRIDHEQDKTHYFSSEEKTIVRDWMKAIMKATIGRDYSKPVISSVNIPTIPLMVAQAMNPAPRPPSPTARDATQKAMRRENPNQLSSRDARVLMGIPTADQNGKDRSRLDSFFTDSVSTINEPDTPGTSTPTRSSIPPPRPSREARRGSTATISNAAPVDQALIDWANTHLPSTLQITDPTGSLCSGLALLRLAESIKGRPSSPPVPDSAFPVDVNDDKLDGLFRLFDFLLDNDVKMGSISINDIRLGKQEKIVQLLRALKAWEDKRKAIAQSIGKGAVQAGGFIAPVGMPWSGM